MIIDVDAFSILLLKLLITLVGISFSSAPYSSVSISNCTYVQESGLRASQSAPIDLLRCGRANPPLFFSSFFSDTTSLLLHTCPGDSFKMRCLLLTAAASAWLATLSATARPTFAFVPEEEFPRYSTVSANLGHDAVELGGLDPMLLHERFRRQQQSGGGGGGGQDHDTTSLDDGTTTNNTPDPTRAATDNDGGDGHDTTTNVEPTTTTTPTTTHQQQPTTSRTTSTGEETSEYESSDDPQTTPTTSTTMRTTQGAGNGEQTTSSGDGRTSSTTDGNVFVLLL